MGSELVGAADVKKGWDEKIGAAIGSLVQKHGLEHVEHYHDEPIWYVGEAQISLVRNQGVVFIEFHKGENNSTAFPIEDLEQDDLDVVLEIFVVGLVE